MPKTQVHENLFRNIFYPLYSSRCHGRHTDYLNTMEPKLNAFPFFQYWTLWLANSNKNESLADVLGHTIAPSAWQMHLSVIKYAFLASNAYLYA